MSAATLTFIGFGTSQTRPVKSRIVALMGTAVWPVSDPARKKSPYEVLRVKETATWGEIRAAYRALAKRHHPDADRFGNGNGSEFVEIQRAYETLPDPVAKARYDCENIARWVGLYPNAGFRIRRRWETNQCW